MADDAQDMTRAQGAANNLMPEGDYSQDGQDPAEVAKLLARISPILLQGEQILYIAQQGRLASLTTLSTPEALVVTTRRFVRCVPKVLGRFSFVDGNWRDLRDVKLKENMVGSTVSVTPNGSAGYDLSGLNKVQARKVYRIMRDMADKASEDRRQLNLEERRATAGGVFVGGAPPAPPVIIAQAPSTPVREDPMATLQKLKGLLDAGLVTPAEFEAKKRDVLGRM